MTSPANPPSVFAAMAAALEQETTLLNSGRRSMTMFHGVRIGSFAGSTYYRFEIPEDILQRSIEEVEFTIGRVRPISLHGNIIATENQFLVVALPRDLGPSLPEVLVSWDYARQMTPVIDALRALPPDALIPRLLLHPTDPANTHVVPFEPAVPPQTPPEQSDVISRALKNRVSLLWGPILSGKSRVLAVTMANYLKAGKRVLYLAPTNDQVDRMLRQMAEIAPSIGEGIMSGVARYDLPSLESAPTVAPYSFDHQIEDQKARKRQVFQERVALLDTYWSVKVKQILHEDFYIRTQELRDKVAELRKLADQAGKEAAAFHQQAQQIQNASLLDKMKKGFSKEDLATALKAAAEKSQTQKRYQQMHQALSGEITSIELGSPVSADETKAFNAATKRIDELGGLDAVTTAVEEFTAIDTSSLLKSKACILTSVATAFLDPTVRTQMADLVVVDDAQSVSIPVLAACAGMAREKCIVAGDPFQLGPESPLNTEAGRLWLQNDLFLFTAGTDDLRRLVEWSEQNKQWCLFLGSQFATTQKLSLWVASAIFSDKITVFASPKARGRITFIDISGDGSRAHQYLGKKRMLPYNETSTRKALECAKHAFVEGKRHSADIGIVVPFPGPTLYSKLMVRMQGMRNVEVGTPHLFGNRRKKAIILDMTMAGVDYTFRSLDDRKIGEHRILRLLNTVFSCVEEDLTVIADLSHFRTVYKDRLITTLLTSLQQAADQQQPNFALSVRHFDDADRKTRTAMFSTEKSSVVGGSDAPAAQPSKEDFELAVQMKMMAKREPVQAPAGQVRNFEREIASATERIIALRTDINLLSQYTGGDMLFRNSFPAEEAAERLPGDMVSGEKEFRGVMERWNTLIYETSGGSKAEHPLLAHKGSESRARLVVRHLKAFYSSDIGAVIEEGKNKIAVEVSRVFQELLGKTQPATPADWSTAYVNFLGKLESYLVWMSEQLRK